jgi:hypothetical protein
LRQDEKLKSLPVLIITGQPEMRRLIYDRPVTPPDGYMNKPITEESLLMNVRKVLSVRH